MEKIAIKVSNKREFEALMKHYEAKGWKWRGGHVPMEYWPHLPTTIQFEDRFGYNVDDDYTILPFPAFAAIAGIGVEKEVVVELPNDQKAFVTKDGVRLHYGWHDLILPKTIDEIHAALHSLD